MKGSSTIKAGLIIATTEVASTDLFKYNSSGFLEKSFTISGHATALASGLVVRTISEYDGSQDANIDRQFQMQSDATLTDASGSFTTTQVKNSTIFKRNSSGLLYRSFVLAGYKTDIAVDLEVKSVSDYDPNEDSRLIRTFEMNASSKLIDLAGTTTIDTTKVKTSTIFKYDAVTKFLVRSFVLAGHKLDVAVGDTVKQVTEYEQTDDANALRSFRMKGSSTIKAGLVILTTEVASTDLFKYNSSGFLEKSFTISGHATALAANLVVRMISEYDGSQDANIDRQFQMQSGATLTDASGSVHNTPTEK